jgi:hypothetical protein
MIDPDKYRITDVNHDWARVYQGKRLVGHVRRGLDSLWYPELPAQKYKSAAVQSVLIADQAVNEFVRHLTEYVENDDER